MLTYNRQYHYSGELLLNRSNVLEKQIRPKDDKVNWLFLKLDNSQFSFVYKIEEPLNAKYNEPFKVLIAFTVNLAVASIVKLNNPYEVLRGEEIIGTIILTKCI